MKNLEDFQKLFKVNFPLEEHHEYYMETLMKSPFYAGIGALAKEFEQYEKDIEDEGFKSTISYKLDHVLPKMKEYIKSTKAYYKLLEIEAHHPRLRKKDVLKHNDDTYLISIDFTAANYNALKSFDSEGEMYGSWEELCSALDVHPLLAKSKSFRQLVFGNTNPKRLGKVQHSNIILIVEDLIENHGFEEDDIVFISHDEFVVRLRPDHALATNRIMLLNAAVGNIIEKHGINMPTHFKVFKNEAIVKSDKALKDIRVQTIYNVKMGGLSAKYDTLFAAPGDKFFKYFKTYILKEALDKRDLMFMSHGEIAVWAEGEDSIVERITPEGELSFKELEEQYPDLINNLKKEVSGLNEHQVRKIANIALEFSYKGY